jgi:N-acetylglucosaminyl-diphospho-decaprenol L-rhamnosyltransferase
MKLLIVILNYRTPTLALDCLRSIEAQVRALGDCRVSLVDGHSDDDSVTQLRAAIEAHGWESWVDFRPLPVNGGFSYGNNRGMEPYLARSPRPDYVLLLNPDTIARDGALMTLVDHMDLNPQVSIAGSRLEDPDGTPQRSAFRFPGIVSEIQHGRGLGPFSRLLSKWQVAPPVTDETIDVDWVAGASMIVRREVFDSIGLLDERYFLYFEEVDFCLRARRAGFVCQYVPASHVVHLVGRASGVTGKGDTVRRLPAYWFESRRRYFTKNLGLVHAALVDIAFAVSLGLYRVRKAVLHSQDSFPPYLLRDHLRHSVLLRGRA